MARPPSADSILRNAKKGSRVVETHADIATDIIIPNQSGVTDHPEFKKYIEDNTYWDRTGSAGDWELIPKTTGDNVTLGDNTKLQLGTDKDFQLSYASATDNLIILDEAAGVRLRLDRTGNFDFQAGDLTTTGDGFYGDVDLTGTLKTNNITSHSSTTTFLNATLTHTTGLSRFDWNIELLNNRGIVIKNAAGTNYDAFFVNTGNVLNFGSPTYSWASIDFLFGSYTPKFRFDLDGDMHLYVDSAKSYFGAGDDVSIKFDGSDMIIASENVTANDELLIKSFDAVVIDSDTYWTGAGSGLPYGEIYAADANNTLTITTTGKANKVQITSFTANGVSNLMTPDHTNDHITITKAGVYKCNMSMHLESVGGGGADNYGYSVYKNNGATEFANLHGQRDLSGGGGDEGSVSVSGLIDLAVNDTIEVWIWNNTNADNIIIDDINLSLVQVGGT